MTTRNNAILERVETLLAKMTLEEKVGQLTQYFHFPGFVPQNENVESELRAGRVGSLLFVSNARETNRLQKLAVEETRLGIPLLFGFDVIHGFRTIFPVPLGLAASWDAELAKQVQTVAAREARSVGIHWAFAPMVDIARDPRWGRIVEGAGEDPYLGARMAEAQVRGFQGDVLGAADRVIAGPKHFVGYGAALGGRDYDEVHLSEGELRNVYLPPFEAAVKAGAGNIMTSYVGIDGVPGTADHHLITEVLRGEFGFDGFTVSDANSVVDLSTHGFTRDDPDSAVRAVRAGLDMEMALGMDFSVLADFAGRSVPTPRFAAFATLVSAVQSGELEEQLIDAAVKRILRFKIQLGLFEQPYVDEGKTEAILTSPAHRDLARVAAERSAVLLQNTAAILPLERSALKSIALIGPFADDKRVMLGPWVFVHDLQSTVSVLEGLQRVAGEGVQIHHAVGVQKPKRTFPSMFEMFEPKGPPAPFDEAAEFERALEIARSSDVAVLVLGEAEDMSGEVASRSTLDIPGRQLELLEAVAQTGTPIVLVLLGGRPLDLSHVLEKAPAILMVWHPGSEGGLAVANLLFGHATPGGKLPFTWPRNVGQVPMIYSHLRSHQPSTQSKRYWEEESTPLFPFGHGLTYGHFEYSNLTLNASNIANDETLHVTVDLHNTSSRALEEVAQLYLHQRHGRAARPVRELKAFQRIRLEAGETRTLRFEVPASARRYWSATDKAYVLDASTFDVWVGGDCTAILGTEFNVS
jgi:beta-glucosidase